MELKEIISEVDRLKQELDQHRPFDEAKLNRLNQKIRLSWNYHSNRIEGNTLTESETKSFILNGITAGGKPFRDYLEMKGHNNVSVFFLSVPRKRHLSDLLVPQLG